MNSGVGAFDGRSDGVSVGPGVAGVGTIVGIGDGRDVDTTVMGRDKGELVGALVGAAVGALAA